MKYLFLPLLLLAGCDEIVSRKQVSEPEQRQEEVDCDKTAFCYTCMPGSGKGCSYKWSMFCDGKQNAIVEHTQFEIRRKSGKIEIYDETQTIKELEQCR